MHVGRIHADHYVNIAYYIQFFSKSVASGKRFRMFIVRCYLFKSRSFVFAPEEEYAISVFVEHFNQLLRILYGPYLSTMLGEWCDANLGDWSVFVLWMTTDRGWLVTKHFGEYIVVSLPLRTARTMAEAVKE